MITRQACSRTILTVSVVLLVGCSSSGKGPDKVSPVITLTGDNPQVIAVGEAYAELGATASDNRDGDLTSSVFINASAIDSAVPGTYQVTYDVSDAAGNAATTVTRTVTIELIVPAETTVSVTGDIKTLNFSWSEPEYVDYYRLMENADGHSGFTQVGDDIPAGTMNVSRDIAVHLFDWVNAQYIVEACNVMGCSSSDVVTATDVMLDTIGYFKASNTDIEDLLGGTLALSADGTTLAVLASREASSATGINGDQTDNSADGAGAVYLFRFDGTSWAQQAYIKASNTEARDYFGYSIALNADGNTLAVGAHHESSGATGIDGDQADNSAGWAGAVYLFRFDGVSWAQQAYIKSTTTEVNDQFGRAVALSADGDTLAVTSWANGGAAYLFRFDGVTWAQQAYFDPPNTPGHYEFGNALALSADGDTLAVASQGDQWNGKKSGAVYLFQFDGLSWAQQAYLKGSNTQSQEYFGNAIALSADGDTLASLGAGAYLFRYDGASWAEEACIKASKNTGALGGEVALSADGNTLVASARSEDSSATGINGHEADNSAAWAGAVYLFRFDGVSWSQQAYIKASNTERSDWFGAGLALSADSATLAVGANGEDSSATGINGDQVDNSARNAGAVYVY